MLQSQSFMLMPSIASRQLLLETYMFIYVSKGLPKGQMVAMTMNVLKWRPKLGLCFWNIQSNLHTIAIVF